MVLSARHGVHSSPAIFAVVLQASHTATEEGSWLPTALDTTAFITQLVVHYIRFEFYL